jgi:hypothetical protein
MKIKFIKQPLIRTPGLVRKFTGFVVDATITPAAQEEVY